MGTRRGETEQSERPYIGQAVTRYVKCQYCKASCPITWTVRSLDQQGHADRVECDSRIFADHPCSYRMENWPDDKLSRVHAIAEAMAKSPRAGDGKGIFLRLAGEYSAEMERRSHAD